MALKFVYMLTVLHMVVLSFSFFMCILDVFFFAVDVGLVALVLGFGNFVSSESFGWGVVSNCFQGPVSFLVFAMSCLSSCHA